ncbi:hypothetical protein AXF42_Ash010661 [Apostasia shenzhenica]|uniref:Transmembrane protein n=1 Tax=Apostasia shenzhenica TaxID=1088818 RepID=A0A2I0A6Q2_9ASPA|nr:hypothetical protein AXF42_Ash010661 [Apostasia shenzhenica]
MEETHVIQIPSRMGTAAASDSGDDRCHQHHQPQQTLFAAMQHHPLTEISSSPGHLLLLKLWQREEGVLAGRIGAKETRLDAIKREAFKLCSLFFFFYGLFLTILFTSSLGQSEERRACRGWWVPACLSLVTSVVLISSVQLTICTYWRVQGQLQRERGEGRSLARCVQELRMKGASFDLSKEPQILRRMQSSSVVQAKWKPLRWFSKNAVVFILLCFTGMMFPASKLILCG